MTEFSPLASGIVTVALLAFLSIFVICFGFGGFHPPLRVVSVTWGIVLAGGVAVWIWSWINILKGKYDLVLDEMKSSIQLPLTCGRKTRKAFAFAEVAGCYVDRLRSGIAKARRAIRTYVPTLRLGSADGPMEKLAEWHDSDRAREFVAWLNEKLRKGLPAQT
jgi:uncharacterized membrane protein (DUF485 family)